MSREFDIIVWGATGFTGCLVAEYLCTHYGVDGDVRWAIAGRNHDKLRRVRTELAEISAAAENLEMILADSFDRPSLDRMVSRSKVICTTVGPYAEYGADLVAACVDAGTDYCDLTGESPFVREMIDAHHDNAKERRVRIVHACGYDSIPSDLGLLFLQQQMLERHGCYASEVRMYTGPTKGTLSGGTFASMAGMLERAGDKRIRRILGDPYALNPRDGHRGGDGPDQSSMRFDETAGKWTAPFVMAGTNTRIVRRSHALQAYEYGRDFRYSEVMGFRKGFRGWRKAAKITCGLGMFMALMLRPSTRRFIFRHFLPKPGEGPGPEQRRNGYFRVDFLALNTENRLWASVSDDLDPGYGSTSKMLAEAALCLALQGDDLPAQFGVVTPAVSIGFPLIRRLQKAGMLFTVGD